MTTTVQCRECGHVGQVINAAMFACASCGLIQYTAPTTERSAP